MECLKYIKFLINAVFYYACLFHIICGICLFVSDKSFKTTAIDSIKIITTNTNLAGLLFITVGVLALPELHSVIKNKIVNLFLLLPQQFFLLLSASSAIQCVINSRFADGAIYPRSFILADQSLLLLLAIFHTISIIFNIVFNADNLKLN